VEKTAEHAKTRAPFRGREGRNEARSENRDGEKRGFKKQGSEKRDFQEKKFKKPGFAKPDFSKRGSSKSGFKKPDFSRPKPKQPAFEKTERRSDTVLLWGLHAVRAAWLNPKRKCFRLWLSESAQRSFEKTIAEAHENLLKRPDAKHSERHDLDRLTPPGSVHQGIVVEVAPLHETSLHDLIAGDNPPDCLVMLDQVTDPHNIGAILRSAAALGAGGVILTERNAPSMTGVLAKSASGAADHIPQVHVVNLSRALDELRDAGYWSVGLAEEGEKNLDACDLSGRTVIVLGAEGEGLRQLTRKKCDELARLPTGGPIGSLNVSNAAAVALYEVKRQKKS
jgi:23S rRNA (guanosine2251-2'-O)-methyltransferase